MSGRSRFTFFRMNSIPYLLPRLILIVILPIYLHLIIDVKSLPIHPLEENPDVSTEGGDEYEYQFDDILPNPMRHQQNEHGRTQIISKRWTKQGVVMFYPSLEYNDHEICYLEKCSKDPDPLRCVKAKNSGGTLNAMVAAGAPTDINSYLVIRNKDGCSSLKGRIGGKQEIIISSQCFVRGAGTAIHEMIHALGYAHEQTRLDRDEYIKINFTNIEEGRSRNFDISDARLYKDFGPYDYYSIMHYNARVFAIDKKYRVLTPKKKGIKLSLMGQHKYLTLGDKVKIRSVTHCPGETYEDHTMAIQNLATRNFENDTSVKAEECLDIE